MSERLRGLAALAAIVRDAELARLRALQEERWKAEAALRRLNTTRLKLSAEAGPDPAHLAGSDERWLTWAAGQGRALGLAGARAAAAAESQLIRARHAYGRCAVLQKLSRGE